jgi:hypothetical protein
MNDAIKQGELAIIQSQYALE